MLQQRERMTVSQTSTARTNYESERAKYETYRSKISTGATKYKEELENTPLFSLDAKYAWNARSRQNRSMDGCKEIPFPTTTSGPFAQSALLGHHVGDHEHIEEGEPIMLNTSGPNSTFICGSQGSGKSYTLNCMLENCLLKDPEYGSVANAVAGIAFNYDAEGGGSLAEVASLCSRGIKVKVLLSASNRRKLEPKYMALPGAEEYLTVDTMAFREKDLDIEQINKLMAFSDSGNGLPLYEQVVGQVLREMGMSDEHFNMRAFESKPEIVGLESLQKKMLVQRINLLKSYLAGHIGHGLEPTSKTLRTRPGELTVVDLTDPFINAATACTLFDIALNLFKQKKPKDGIIIVLDEAHRYMNESAAAQKFTDNLLATIREQRHTATRVVIATQEPTISERLLDLCNTSIVHRFNSPAWFKSIKEHLAGASTLLSSETESNELFGNIVNLDVGESFVFSPSSFVCVDSKGEQKLGTGFMKMKTRSRKGLDSGKTKLAGDPDNSTDDADATDDDGITLADGDEEQKALDHNNGPQFDLSVRPKPFPSKDQLFTGKKKSNAKQKKPSPSREKWLAKQRKASRNKRLQTREEGEGCD